VTKVLYVEDNDDNVFMLKTRLELLGDFEVLTAEDGEKGCEMAAAEWPDIIPMDLEMPVVDGWEAVRARRAPFAANRISTPRAPWRSPPVRAGKDQSAGRAPAAYPDNEQRIATHSLRRKMARSQPAYTSFHRRGQNFFWPLVASAGAGSCGARKRPRAPTSPWPRAALPLSTPKARQSLT
jgi:hypothetical protein